MCKELNSRLKRGFFFSPATSPKVTIYKLKAKPVLFSFSTHLREIKVKYG